MPIAEGDGEMARKSNRWKFANKLLYHFHCSLNCCQCTVFNSPVLFLPLPFTCPFPYRLLCLLSFCTKQIMPWIYLDIAGSTRNSFILNLYYVLLLASSFAPPSLSLLPGCCLVSLFLSLSLYLSVD